MGKNIFNFIKLYIKDIKYRKIKDNFNIKL